MRLGGVAMSYIRVVRQHRTRLRIRWGVVHAYVLAVGVAHIINQSQGGHLSGLIGLVLMFWTIVFAVLVPFADGWRRRR